MRNPKNKLQIFAILGFFAGKMEKFSNTGEVKLEAHEVEKMKEIYPDIQVFGGGAMPNNLNTQCIGCIKDAFEVFTSLYNRLKRDPDVNGKAGEVLADDAKKNAPEPEKPKPLTAEEKKVEKQLKDRVAKLSELGFEELDGFLTLQSIGVSIPVSVLKAESKESFEANLESFKHDIEHVKNEALDARFETRTEQLKELGFVVSEDGKSFTKGDDEKIDSKSIRILDEQPFEDTLKVLRDEFEASKIEPEKPKTEETPKLDEKEVSPLKEVTDVPKETEPKAKKKKVTFENPE